MDLLHVRRRTSSSSETVHHALVEGEGSAVGGGGRRSERSSKVGGRRGVRDHVGRVGVSLLERSKTGGKSQIDGSLREREPITMDTNDEGDSGTGRLFESDV